MAHGWNGWYGYVAYTADMGDMTIMAKMKYYYVGPNVKSISYNSINWILACKNLNQFYKEKGGKII